MKRSYLIVIIILVLLLLTSLFLIFKNTIFTKKTTTGNSASIVLENSYLFASPIQAKADDKSLPADRWEKIRLTVFILDGKGLGVPNQTINLSVPPQLNLTNIQNITDDSGKAVFDLSSPTAGQFSVSAHTQKGTVPQQVKVVFY